MVYQGVEISFKDNEVVSLTNMWKAAGSVQKKLPAHWLENRSTQELLQQFQTETNYPISDILNKTVGKGGGTYAHWKLGLSYAGFLSPEIHSWYMDVVKERFEETADPDLIIERYREQFRKKGMSEDQIDERILACCKVGRRSNPWARWAVGRASTLVAG